MQLVYYKPQVIQKMERSDLAGLEQFLGLFGAMRRQVSLVDRTGTIRFPIALQSRFPIPELRKCSMTFEEVCNRRARELLDSANRLGTRLYVLWSGGIDSTLVLVSLLKVASPAELRNITVMLSEDSIGEYPEFYKRFIRGRLTVEPAMAYPHVLGTPCIIVSGEHNDQLFGSDFVVRLINQFGPAVIHKPYDRGMFRLFFDPLRTSPRQTELYLDLFERLAAASPVPIDTAYDYLWWINFTLKWQAVYMRTLSYVAGRNALNIDEKYLTSYYHPFFCTSDFQLWSMNNMDKKMRKDWSSYKWVCKSIVFEYARDEMYREEKMKRGSLYFLLLRSQGFGFIRRGMIFCDTIDLSEYYVSHNDFSLTE